MKNFMNILLVIVFLFIIAKIQIEKENKKRSKKIANSIMNPLIKEDWYGFIDDENFFTYSLQEAKERYKNSWQKSFGGKYDEIANGIAQINNGGIIVAGSITSLDSSNEYILKLDSFGNKIWEKIFEGDFDDFASAIIQTDDGGFLIGGTKRYCKKSVSNLLKRNVEDFFVLELKP